MRYECIWTCACTRTELMVPYFALLYWILDKYKCVYGIWLVPVSEVLNGCLKWYIQHVSMYACTAYMQPRAASSNHAGTTTFRDPGGLTNASRSRARGAMLHAPASNWKRGGNSYFVCHETLFRMYL